MEKPDQFQKPSLIGASRASPGGIGRRAFLGLSVAAMAPLPAFAAPDDPPRARRPQPPYRVWFQPRLFDRDMDLYRHMTIDASGWLDPRLAELAGKTALDWVYGLNHPDARGPGYWRDSCSVPARSRPQEAPRLISAGIAVDEWVSPKLPDNERWLAEGLRAGRRADPRVFIAVWTTDPTPALIELGRDGTVDLIIVEGYTHSVTPGLTVSWEGALRRCEALGNAGLLDRTIYSFGHITNRADSRGERLRGAWLRKRAQELKRRFPQMPGVAFFQTDDPESPELRALVQFCDRLSGELWPGPREGR